MDKSDSRSVHEQAVAAAFFHDLRVPGDDGDARKSGRDANRFHAPCAALHRKSLFEDERKAQKKGLCAAHGQVIHGSVYGQRSDVASRKKQAASRRKNPS